MALQGGEAIPSHCTDWAHRHRFTPFPGSGRMTSVWRLVFKILEYYLPSGLFLKGCILQRPCTARRGRVGADHGRAKKMILTMHLSDGSSGFKIYPLSTSRTPNDGKSRILQVTGTLWGLPCPCNCPVPAPCPSRRQLVVPQQSWHHHGSHFPTLPVLLSSFPMNLSEQLSMLCAVKIKDEVSRIKSSQLPRGLSQHAGNRNVAIRLGDEIILDMLA